MKVGIKLRKPDSVWEKYVRKLKKYSEVEVIYDSAMKDVYDDIEVMITTHLSESVLAKFPGLKAVFLFKTGMDGLPLCRLESRNIFVQCSHANADVIAEHAIALSLSLLHRIPEFHNDLRSGVWYSNGQNYMWKSISNMKVGILGYGHIGEAIYRRLAGFQCEVWAYNRSQRYSEGLKGAGDVQELIANCDLIYICLPKTEETCSLINKEILQSMKGKFIVNVGRAQVCDEKALYEALNTGSLAGYASDVWYEAPDKTDREKRVLPSKYPYGELKNVVMSPHCATHETDAHERYIQDAVESCIKYVLGEH